MGQNGSTPQKITTIAFALGPYGEILPPAQGGPSIGAANEESENRWTRLQTILAGNYEGEIECALYQAVITRGAPLSLRTPNSPAQRFNSFAPVLTHLGNFRWRIGLIGHGRLETFVEPDTAKAVDHALMKYQEWAQAELGSPLTEQREKT